MNYSKIKIIILLVIGLVGTSQINAQLCGKYGATLNLKSDNGKPVENAFVQLLPIEKDETRGQIFVRDGEDPAKFSITFLEGHQIKTKYKLLISADGFETVEKEISFPHCERQIFNIQLKSDKKTNLAVLSGSVYDANGYLITQAKVTAINEKGDMFETQTNSNGIYILRLPFNPYKAGDYRFRVSKYEIIVEKEGFEKGIIRNFKFVPAFNNGKMKLDFALDVRPCDDCEMIKGTTIEENNNK
jgi:hypothetical protein